MSIAQYFKMAAPILSGTPTWFSVHHRITYTDGRPPIFPGNAFDTIRSAIDDASYWSKHGHCVYLSQGMFRAPGVHKFGPFPSADRTYANLVACKNLYMDMDVKEGAYATTRDAMQALKDFVIGAKLPMPTIIVGSGSGGLHVYWTLNAPMDLKEFLNMAGRLITAAQQWGIHFDVQCTRDATRLLRVAGTWNFKNATVDIPATPVTLLRCAEDHLDIEVMRSALAPFPAITHQGNSAPRQTGETDKFGNPLDEVEADTSGGMKGDYPPANIDEVAMLCPFIKNTLEDGGASLVSDPQWHLVTAIACHCTEPVETVHRLCKGNQYYTPEGAEEKLATAQLAREQRKEIGPPSCAYIALQRPECKTCEHLSRNSRPTQLRFARTRGAAHTSKSGNTAPNANDLPLGYFRGLDKLIYRHKVDDGGVNTPELAFEYQILPGTGRVETGAQMVIIFDTVQGEKEVTKRFDCGKVANVAPFAEAMYGAAMPIVNPKVSREFMQNYLSLLQESKNTMVDIPAFGWSQDAKGEMGFSYAGVFVSPNGTIRCQQPGEGTENYRVTGDDKVWRDLIDIILTPTRPDVACMVASSFGAPLVGMTGHPGLLLGLISPSSGIGKSTALIAGQTVWSSPVVGGLTDTVVYTFSKLTTLRHLPVYYDEIKGDKQIDNMTLIAFQLTGGHEKGRADRSGNMKKVKEFRTLCGYAANGSIVAGVRDADRGTDASWLRMFEMNAILVKTDKNNYAANVNQLLSALNQNHGGIGRIYAKFLGENHTKINTMLTSYQDKLAESIGADPKVERFWIAAMATTLLGATFANALKLAKFPINEMRTYMIGEYRRMRQEMVDDPSDYTQDAAFLNVVGQFLNEKFPRNLVILNKTWTQKHKPPKGYATVLNHKSHDSGWGTLEVQVSGDPLVLRISDSALTEWCKRTRNPKTGLVKQFVDKLNGRLTTTTIGGGSHLASAAAMGWVINAKGTILEDILEYTVNYQMLPP